ncbi:DUF1054 domain-containing protein [Kyrpidia tusciae]|uniref:Uncharacterized protein n=1 Tax=Kyrpidia tusciae (strain DSM 2912 / NBRC 15312 / T2) TaxID=562970 RepID=D5WTK8_KYRT2|nr:DUF1054 domain-containing protein [Kyrpidia tusciae]ADG07244.1 protein of unknown function DUF1054 [Kyrpidia tusciae DSM 2912]
MVFNGFEAEDFAVFSIPEFEARMEAIRSRVRPKLTALADELAPRLSRETGAPFYPHVAAHARRKVNPPDETWMALSRSPRGYKRYAHFEVGIGAEEVFVRLVIKPEADDKPGAARWLREHGEEAAAILPSSYLWALHRDGASDRPWPRLDGGALQELGVALEKKAAGLTVGRRFGQQDPVLAERQSFLTLAERVLLELFPLYEAVIPGAEPSGEPSSQAGAAR